jgi:hypothetical protein
VAEVVVRVLEMVGGLERWFCLRYSVVIILPRSQAIKMFTNLFSFHLMSYIVIVSIITINLYDCIAYF